MKIEDWDGLIETLRACHDFMEDGYEDTTVEPGEASGQAHAARLLGHITDAMLIAVWIKGVALAYAKREEQRS
jgi:hypothetical protein